MTGQPGVTHMTVLALFHRSLAATLLAGALAFVLPAQAALEIDISGGTESGVPIAVVPFEQPGAVDDLARIIGDDLARSGLFAPIARDAMPGRPASPDQLRIDDWRAGKARYLVMGQVESDGDKLRTRFYLIDVSSGERLAGSQITATASADRSVAHRISDIVYEELTGERGAFSTRLAYVTERGTPEDRTYTLQIADSDGANPRTVLQSPYPIMSPSWSPDGGQLAYVSFEGNRSAIWVQDLSTGERYQLTDYSGINGAPAWSRAATRLPSPCLRVATRTSTSSTSIPDGPHSGPAPGRSRPSRPGTRTIARWPSPRIASASRRSFARRVPTTVPVD